MTLDTITTFFTQDFMVAGIVLAFSLAIAVIISSTWIIDEDQSGLVIKKYGPSLSSGRLVALDGEAGYQARLLAPGWHFVPFRWQRTAQRHDIDPETLRVRQVPGEAVGIVTSLDGRPITAGDLAGPSIEGHDSFQLG